MKTRTLMLAGFSLLLWTMAAVAEQAVPTPARHLTRKQAVHLINNASTPEDHRALAQYFRQEAQRKRQKEQSYRETAATYRLHPPRVDLYRNVSMADSYNQWADEARATALADLQLATFQDKLAEGVEQSK
jgi:hypothetical protein